LTTIANYVTTDQRNWNTQMPTTDYYADLCRKLGVKEVCAHRWQVTYNGSIMGDDRGYSTERECWSEVDARIRQDETDARRYNRPILLTK
jgi:hypothetical protein